MLQMPCRRSAPRWRQLVCLAVALLWSNASGATTVVNFNYFDRATKICSSVGGCGVTFNAIPSAKALLILRVSCRITTTNSPQRPLYSVELQRLNNAGIQKGREFLMNPIGIKQTSAISVYLLNDQTMLAVPQGDNPVVIVSVGNDPISAISVDCTIHGVLSNFTP
jgi:hypothetical protein